VLVVIVVDVVVSVSVVDITVVVIVVVSVSVVDTTVVGAVVVVVVNIDTDVVVVVNIDTGVVVVNIDTGIVVVLFDMAISVVVVICIVVGVCSDLTIRPTTSAAMAMPTNRHPRTHKNIDNGEFMQQ
jgi:hypothetical protein